MYRLIIEFKKRDHINCLYDTKAEAIDQLALELISWAPSDITYISMHLESEMAGEYANEFDHDPVLGGEG